MIVRCLHKDGKNLPNEITRNGHGWTSEAKFPLSIGKNYTVYAMEILHGCIWYYIEDEDFDGDSISYPIHYPACLFEIEDGRFSKYWTLDFQCEGKTTLEDYYQVIAFKEWIEEDAFYDLLTDGNEREVEVYKKYRMLIDEEFL